MVTILDKNSSVELYEKYTKLFHKAFEDLKEVPGALSSAELAAGRFDGLDSYFAHMGDLIGLQKPMYILLPLDEAPFVINANARTVTIPNEFAKCGAVKGDNFCEIATFTIDRYFDYKDLADASIAVQWVNANKEEGISHIHLIDLESIEGKIRFGWPLTEDITKYPGQVQFAVRFYVEDESNKGKFKYLLNTLTNSLMVKDGLNLVNPMHERADNYDMFASFIKNSQNPAYTIPVTPLFVEANGGIDLKKYGAIDLDSNMLELKAQAVAADLGAITYKWIYVPSGTDNKIEILESNATYTVEPLKHVEVNPIPEKKRLDKYFINTGSEEAKSFEEYLGDWPPEEGTKLYEVVSALTINDTETDVVGEYWVEAVNTIGTNSTNPSPSTHCIVPAPHAVEYNKNLKAHEFALAAAAGSTPKVDLAIELKPDGNNPDISYTWYKSTESPTSGYEVIRGAETNVYTASEPAWYKVAPLARLNRKEEDNVSNVCKVTRLPAAPVIQKLWYKLIAPHVTEYSELTKDQDMYPAYKFGDTVKLKIDTDLDDGNLLYTENLTYEWYVQEPDKMARKLTESDKGLNTLVDVDSNLNSKEIVVRCVSDGSVFNYFCIITNTINGKTAEINSSSYNTFTIA